MNTLNKPRFTVLAGIILAAVAARLLWYPGDSSYVCLSGAWQTKGFWFYDLLRA
jgi:hypothetical protein